MSKSSRAHQFIELFNKVDDHLSSHLGRRRHRSEENTWKFEDFSKLLVEASKEQLISESMRRVLADFAELRNVIVHRREYPGRVVADPTEETLQEFRLIRDSIIRPVTVEALTTKNVDSRQPDERLSDVLIYMREHAYSQVIFRTDNGLQILSTEGIARWLEHSIDGDGFLAEKTTAVDALRHEPQGSFQLMPRTDPATKAQRLFASTPSKNDESRLFAIIVTQNGKSNEKPLGILTPWDLIGFDPLSNQ